MKKIILLMLIIVMAMNLSFAKGKSVSFFSPKSIYVYAEGGYFGINPYEPYEYGNREWKATMIFGAGFTFLNIYNRYKLNFEFDFATPKYTAYSDGYIYDQSITFYNYKLGFEYLLRNGRLSFFGGVGVSNIKYLENDLFYDYSLTVMMVEFGVKVAISKNIFMRAEYKHLFDSDSYDYYSYSYYGDEGYPIAGALAMGLEFKF